MPEPPLGGDLLPQVCCVCAKEQRNLVTPSVSWSWLYPSLGSPATTVVDELRAVRILCNGPSWSPIIHYPYVGVTSQVQKVTTPCLLGLSEEHLKGREEAFLGAKCCHIILCAIPLHSISGDPFFSLPAIFLVGNMVNGQYDDISNISLDNQWLASRWNASDV